MSEKMPFELRNKIKADIQERLNPKYSYVFLRLSVVQFFASFLVLLFCPQFDLGFFSHSPFGHLLMSLGDWACNFFCGGIFLGSGTLLSLFILTPDEIRVLRKTGAVSLFIMALLSLASFMLFGVEFQLMLFTAWVIGALVVSMMSLEIYWRWGRV